MKFKLLLSLLAISLGGFFSEAYAQHDGDEQGMEIPEGLDLKQDAQEFLKAKNGW